MNTFSQTARRTSSIRLSHSRVWFQLANVGVTIAVKNHYGCSRLLRSQPASTFPCPSSDAGCASAYSVASNSPWRCPHRSDRGPPVRPRSCLAPRRHALIACECATPNKTPRVARAVSRRQQHCGKHQLCLSTSRSAMYGQGMAGPAARSSNGLPAPRADPRRLSSLSLQRTSPHTGIGAARVAVAGRLGQTCGRSPLIELVINIRARCLIRIDRRSDASDRHDDDKSSNGRAPDSR